MIKSCLQHNYFMNACTNAMICLQERSTTIYTKTYQSIFKHIIHLILFCLQCDWIDFYSSKNYQRLRYKCYNLTCKLKSNIRLNKKGSLILYWRQYILTKNGARYLNNSVQRGCKVFTIYTMSKYQLNIPSIRKPFNSLDLHILTISIS